MVTLKEIHPYEGHEDWVLHYAEDENGNRYYILQVETGILYESAIDLYPCRYTYKVTNEPVKVEKETEE